MQTPTPQLQSVRLYNGRIYYTLQHTDKKQVGIYSVCVKNPTDPPTNELPNADTSVGTNINVYGGECMGVCPHGIVFANAQNTTLCVIKDTVIHTVIGDGLYHYADVVYNDFNDTITYVCEHIKTHHQHIARYDFTTGKSTVLAKGSDFYHCPTVYQNSTAWHQWDKRHMPWDDSEIMANGKILSTGCGHFQPHFAPNGDIYYVKDTGTYHHIFCNGNNITPNSPMDFYMPLWIYGMRTFTIVGHMVICIGVKHGIWQMGKIVHKNFIPFDMGETPPSEITSLHSDHTEYVVYIAKYPHRPDSIQLYHIPSNTHQTVYTAGNLPIDTTTISIAEPVQFKNRKGDGVHGFYYPPKNPIIPKTAPLPPLLVKSHGGPTGQTTPSYTAKIQFWTSRGFAVLDVNYSGSTGFGTAYRNRLNGQWGVLDVADLADGVAYCIKNALCNAHEVCISGSSAGGYAVLCALLQYPHIFTAGCSLYGIGNLHALARETHKFESRYLDTLIAPYHTEKSLYDHRSPIRHAEKFKTPILVLQGDKDRVVPPNQAYEIFNALKVQAIPTALIMYSGEAHGFKNPMAKAHALDAELQFYKYVFNGTPANYPIGDITHIRFDT